MKHITRTMIVGVGLSVAAVAASPMSSSAWHQQRILDLQHRRSVRTGPQRGSIQRQLETIQGRTEKEMGQLHGR